MAGGQAGRRRRRQGPPQRRCGRSPSNLPLMSVMVTSRLQWPHQTLDNSRWRACAGIDPQRWRAALVKVGRHSTAGNEAPGCCSVRCCFAAWQALRSTKADTGCPQYPPLGEVPLLGRQPQRDANKSGDASSSSTIEVTSALSPIQAITAWARRSTFSARLMATKIADRLVMVGCPASTASGAHSWPACGSRRPAPRSPRWR